MQRALSSSIVLFGVLAATATAQVAEGPGMTAARELDLAAHHLAATAQQQARDGQLTSAAAETAEGFAVLVRDFRFDLESDRFSSLQAEVAWAQVAEGFSATRDLLHDKSSRDLRHELLRVHALMNRLDRGFGGPGFWSGPQGWSG
jgi:hypothetical protein